MRKTQLFSPHLNCQGRVLASTAQVTVQIWTRRHIGGIICEEFSLYVKTYDLLWEFGQ
jgi:hypothetical protein